MAHKYTSKTFSLSLLAGVIGQLLIGSQAGAQTSDETEAQKEEKIVVVGRRISQTDIGHPFCAAHSDPLKRIR